MTVSATDISQWHYIFGHQSWVWWYAEASHWYSMSLKILRDTVRPGHHQQPNLHLLGWFIFPGSLFINLSFSLSTSLFFVVKMALNDIHGPLLMFSSKPSYTWWIRASLELTGRKEGISIASVFETFGIVRTRHLALKLVDAVPAIDAGLLVLGSILR